MTEAELAYETMREKIGRVPAAEMTLRDHFAANAIASIPLRHWEHVGGDKAIIEAWATCAYAVSDAMLKARVA